MNPRAVLGFTGLLLAVTGLFMALPLGVALWDRDPGATFAYAVSMGAIAVIALLFRVLARGAQVALHRKDALGTVALTWLLLGPVGALPLLLDGAITDPTGAIFEAVSGFTTTGATVVADVDALSRATNLWRCLMHWIGGMGIVVLFVAVFPQLGVGAKQLFKTEVPGLPSEGLRPRIRETATALWWVYLGLTAACAGLLWLEGMSPYDAVAHAFSTLGTGGFSTRTASVGAWESPWIHWTIAAFMLIAGMNFGLYYGVLRGRWRDLLQNAELRFYLLANAVLILAVLVLLGPSRHGLEATLREASFQVLAVTTTTGFMTADFDTYPDFARLLLWGAMFMGGCAGSTAGGLKAARVLLLIRLAKREQQATVQPHAVSAVRLGRGAVPEPVLAGVLVFVATFLGLFALASAVMGALGLDLVTSTSAAIACLSSIGPGLAGVGPSQNYAFIPAIGKLVLCLCMLAGRLEIFALFAIFTPECWRR
ncbi:MAG: potassium transporter TrkG [Pseudomonadota bacterium]